jgi:2-hydroxy-6-oxonona-2,4-dienedioate hydrolase
MSSSEPGKGKRLFKNILSVVLVIFLLISIIPYLIPLKSSNTDLYDLAFDNSIFSEIGQVKLHYRSWVPGEAGRGNILLVHGFGGSTFSWRYTAPYLAEKGFYVVAADLPGFGLSERVPGYNHTAENRATHIWTLMDELAPGQNWHLVGHSMGGATVAEMALQRPAQTKSLTLAAGAVIERGLTQPNILLRYPPAARWARVLSTNYFISESRVAQLLVSAYGRTPSSEEVSGYYLPLTVQGTDRVLIDLLQTGITTPGQKLAELTVPVLCLWGEADAWVPLEQGETAAAIIPGAELVVIPGEGHCPMETAPEQFNRELFEFIRAED